HAFPSSHVSPPADRFLVPPLLLPYMRVIPPPLSFSTTRPPPRPTLFPYTTLFRSRQRARSMRFLSHTTQKYPKSGCARTAHGERSEEHTSELQSRFDLVCRLLLEKKKRRRGKRAGCCNRTRDETAG